MDIEQQIGMEVTKENRRNFLIGILIGIFLLSLGFNVVTGVDKWKAKIHAQGVKDGQDALVQQIRSGAFVNLEDGVIGFIKK